MVCSFSDPEKIKEWIEICKLMKDMNSVVHFQFKPTELYIQMKHSSNRCILDMTFPCSWFSFYEWKETDIYISTRSLFTIFSRYSGEKIISMESEKKYFLIKCFHDKQHKNFSIPLLYHPHKTVVVQSDPGIEFKIESDFLHTICKELYSFDEFVYFNVKKEFFHMISHRDEKMVVEVQPSMIERLDENKEEKTYENTFDLTYLLIFLKFLIIYPIIRVRLSNVLLFSIEKDYTLYYYICSIKS